MNDFFLVFGRIAFILTIASVVVLAGFGIGKAIDKYYRYRNMVYDSANKIAGLNSQMRFAEDDIRALASRVRAIEDAMKGVEHE